MNSSFTVRKLSCGEGVEQVFQQHGPQVAGVTVVRRGRVRRAKLYYLRGRTGKAARTRKPQRARHLPPDGVRREDNLAGSPYGGTHVGAKDLRTRIGMHMSCIVRMTVPV